MADSRTRAGNVKHEPGASLVAERKKGGEGGEEEEKRREKTKKGKE